jgi:predicted SAM-dependent methyltransferase
MRRIIIGAGKTNYEDWIPTQETELNLLNIKDYFKIFEKEKSVDAFLAEHVFEHLSYEEGIEAGRNLYKFLKHDGYVRVAVPDINFKNEWYHDMCKPGGPGPIDHPAYTHKVFYDYKTLIEVFETAGFKVDLLEYCDENGRFHFNYWNPKQGIIGRSLRFDTRNNDGILGMVSIIIDAYKK